MAVTKKTDSINSTGKLIANIPNIISKDNNLNK